MVTREWLLLKIELFNWWIGYYPSNDPTIEEFISKTDNEIKEHHRIINSWIKKEIYG